MKKLNLDLIGTTAVHNLCKVEQILNEIVDWINQFEKTPFNITFQGLTFPEAIAVNNPSITLKVEKPIEKKCENCQNNSYKINSLQEICGFSQSKVEGCLTNNYKYFKSK